MRPSGRQAGAACNVLGRCGGRCYLLLQHAVEDEDEHALQRVEDGEEVGHDHRALVDVHEAEGPGQAQQAEQGDGADHPGPGGTRGRLSCWCHEW